MKIAKKILSNFEGYVCAVLLAVMCVVVFLQVIFRFVLHGSLPWSEELSRYLQVFITFWGTAYGIKTGAHLGIEAFTYVLPKKGREILAVFVDIVGAAVCVLLVKLSMDIIISQIASGQRSPAMRIPMYLIYGAIPTGMVFCVIRYIVEIVKGIKALFGKKEELL